MSVSFIPPSEVIKQIRSLVPSFSDRVAGAAQFEAIEDIQKCLVPACFVLLADNEAETISMQTSLNQDVFHGFDIVLILDAKDIRKQEPEEVSVAFKELILHAINGWKPAGYDDASPLMFLGDNYQDADRSRYVRVYRFIQDYRWCSATDGVGEGDLTDLGNFDKFFADLLVDNDPDKVLQSHNTDLYNP